MNRRLLNINILDHPSNSLKTVFFFIEENHSEYFKELLISGGISYEFQYDESENKFYFGIENRHLKPVMKMNYLVFARYRKPFIENSIVRILLIAITLIFITLAIAGYFLT